MKKRRLLFGLVACGLLFNGVGTIGEKLDLKPSVLNAIPANTTYERLESLNDIDSNAQYVLGLVLENNSYQFHYEGTSSWGKVNDYFASNPYSPLFYTLTLSNDKTYFNASTVIDENTYYLQVPTSNTFSMSTSVGTNTSLIIGTTQVASPNYGVANKNTTARHLRINGTSGLRSYAGTTGSMAYFYKVVESTPDSFTITFDSNGGTAIESQTVSKSDADSGTRFNRPTNPSLDNYDFVGWYTIDGDLYDFSSYPSTLTVYAYWDIKDEVIAANRWSLVTTVDDIHVNDRLIFVSSSSNKTLSSYDSANNKYTSTDIRRSTDLAEVETIENFRTFAVRKGTTSGVISLMDETENKYLSSTSSKTNVIGLSETKSAESNYTITIGDDYKAKLTTQGEKTHNTLWYNSGSFTNYVVNSNAQGLEEIYIYKSSIPAEAEKTITIDAPESATYGFVGQTYSFTTSFEGYDVDPTELLWDTTDNEIASIDDNGVLTPHKFGTIQVYCTDGNVTSNYYDFQVYSNGTSISIGEAILRVNNSIELDKTYTMEGTIKTIDTEYSSQYNNITFTITDGNDDLKCFRTTGLCAETVKVGDSVAVTGKLSLYQNKPQVDANSSFNAYYTVTLNYGGNGTADSVTNNFMGGTVFNRPADPTWTNHSFLGWFNGNTEWDFSTSITENTTLTARWLAGSSEEVQNDLNDINPYFALAYKYEAVHGKLGTIINSNYLANDSNTQVTTKEDFESKICSLPSEIESISLTRVYPGKNNTIKFGSSSSGGSLTFNSTSKINKILVTASAYRDGEDSFQIGNNKYTATGEEVSCSFAEGQDSVEISSSKRLYISKIVFVFESDEIIYTDVDLRLKVAIDDMSTFAGVYDSIQDYGIEVRTSAKTKKYAHSAMLSETKGNKDYRYQVITLGDVINHPERLTDEFTIRAYAVYGSETLYSTSEKSYSVVTLVQEYYSNESTRSIITPFYNLLVSMGKITA